eukprot:782558-Rhodomonas_salina.1
MLLLGESVREGLRGESGESLGREERGDRGVSSVRGVRYESSERGEGIPKCLCPLLTRTLGQTSTMPKARRSYALPHHSRMLLRSLQATSQSVWPPATLQGQGPSNSTAPFPSYRRAMR